MAVFHLAIRARAMQLDGWEQYSLHLSAGLYLLIVNGWTVFVFWWDKRQAGMAGWRISERWLLWLARLGGSAGARYAQVRFRHKTRKEPFRSDLNRIIAGQVFGVVLVFAVFIAPFVKKPEAGWFPEARVAGRYPAWAPQAEPVRELLLVSPTPRANPRLISSDG